MNEFDVRKRRYTGKRWAYKLDARPTPSATPSPSTGTAS